MKKFQTFSDVVSIPLDNLYLAPITCISILYPNLSILSKDAVKSVLRIGSAHNKGEPADINIAQIFHLSNFSDIKILVYIHLRA